MRKHIDQQESLLYDNVETLHSAVVEMLRLDVNSGTTANKVQAVRVGGGGGCGDSSSSSGKTMTTEARTFYTHFDGILYECSWYEHDHKIVVVGGVKEQTENSERSRKKGKDKEKARRGDVCTVEVEGR